MEASKLVDVCTEDNVTIARVLIGELTDVDQVAELYGHVQTSIESEVTPRLIIRL